MILKAICIAPTFPKCGLLFCAVNITGDIKNFVFNFINENQNRRNLNEFVHICSAIESTKNAMNNRGILGLLTPRILKGVRNYFKNQKRSSSCLATVMFRRTPCN